MALGALGTLGALGALGALGPLGVYRHDTLRPRKTLGGYRHDTLRPHLTIGHGGPPGPQRAPKAPKGPQRAPKGLQKGAEGPQKGPKWPQKGPKGALRYSPLLSVSVVLLRNRGNSLCFAKKSKEFVVFCYEIQRNCWFCYEIYRHRDVLVRNRENLVLRGGS